MGKDWIPKNLKKGRCTPMPNPDCPVGSPQYNLGMTFKKHAGEKPWKKATGGLIGMDDGGLAAQGRGGDTELVHVNKKEKSLLNKMGGSGTVNPMTGLKEYFPPALALIGPAIAGIGGAAAATGAAAAGTAATVGTAAATTAGTAGAGILSGAAGATTGGLGTAVAGSTGLGTATTGGLSSASLTAAPTTIGSTTTGTVGSTTAGSNLPLSMEGGDPGANQIMGSEGNAGVNQVTGENVNTGTGDTSAAEKSTNVEGGQNKGDVAETDVNKEGNISKQKNDTEQATGDSMDKSGVSDAIAGIGNEMNAMVSRMTSEDSSYVDGGVTNTSNIQSLMSTDSTKTPYNDLSWLQKANYGFNESMYNRPMKGGTAPIIGGIGKIDKTLKGIKGIYNYLTKEGETSSDVTVPPEYTPPATLEPKSGIGGGQYMINTDLKRGGLACKHGGACGHKKKLSKMMSYDVFENNNYE